MSNEINTRAEDIKAEGIIFRIICSGLMLVIIFHFVCFVVCLVFGGSAVSNSITQWGQNSKLGQSLGPTLT